MRDKKISIIGLGLIGGSLAKVLRERMGVQDITAVNRSALAIDQALAEGIITRGFHELNDDVFHSDIVFICTPVKYAMQYIDVLAQKAKKDCIVTDVGSTKSEITEYINTMPCPPCFIGGHPMAGAEKTGYSAGFSHLFENAYYMLTPSKSSTKEAMDCLIEMVNGIGGIPMVLDAEEHDRITGSISHVPHIVAAALVNMVKELDSSDGKMQLLAAGGFKDITRIASSSPEMWESIIMSNRQPIQDILNFYIEQLNTFKKYIENNQTEKIYTFFDSSRSYRDSFPNRKKGLINPYYEIVVDVVDQPGTIGEIATILGSNGVNIKNINVSNSREYEQGCLRISLPTMESVNIAFDLLINRGYKVYKVS